MFPMYIYSVHKLSNLYDTVQLSTSLNIATAYLHVPLTFGAARWSCQHLPVLPVVFEE